MNKKQLIVAWVVVILIVIFFGLETTHTDYQDPIGSSIDLSIYGKYIGSDIAIPSYPALGMFAYSGNYKYYLIVAAFLIGVLLIYTLRDKKRQRQLSE
jgi:hypothetical protein